MKLFPVLLLLSFGVMAQEPAAPPPGGRQRPEPKNLKLLQPSELMPAMSEGIPCAATLPNRNIDPSAAAMIGLAAVMVV